MSGREVWTLTGLCFTASIVALFCFASAFAQEPELFDLIDDPARVSAPAADPVTLLETAILLIEDAIVLIEEDDDPGQPDDPPPPSPPPAAGLPGPWVTSSPNEHETIFHIIGPTNVHAPSNGQASVTVIKPPKGAAVRIEITADVELLAPWHPQRNSLWALYGTGRFGKTDPANVVGVVGYNAGNINAWHGLTIRSNANRKAQKSLRVSRRLPWSVGTSKTLTFVYDCANGVRLRIKDGPTLKLSPPQCKKASSLPSDRFSNTLGLNRIEDGGFSAEARHRNMRIKITYADGSVWEA